MKKFFKAIGNFFVKIWNWIRDTAWIQPLLIVGLIFGVIFSIPSISKGIKNLSDNSGKYAFINKNTMKSDELLKYESEKKDFLLVLVEEECENCTVAEKGFKYFKDTDSFFYDDAHKNPEIKFMYTWKQDQVDSEDDAQGYLNWVETNQAIIEEVYIQTCEANGITPVDYGDDSLGNFTTGVLPVPAMIRYEAGIITDVYFGIEGNNKVERATFISDFWFHEGKFDGNASN